MMNVHLHKFKPLTPRSTGIGLYDRVKFVIQDIIERQHVDEALVNNIFAQLEGEKIADEAEQEKKASRLREAEKAGEEAAKRYKDAMAAKKQRKADYKIREQKAQEAKRRRVAGRKSMREELESGNEVERHFADMEAGPILALQMRDDRNQPQEGPPNIDGPGTSGLSLVAPEKRKSVNSHASSTSSLSDFSLSESNKPTQQESAPSPESQTSALTAYTAEEIDAILSGAEVIEEFKSLSLEPSPQLTPQIPSLAPDIVVDEDPTSDDEAIAGQSSTPPTSTDDFTTAMPPPPPPRRQTRLTRAERAEQAEERERLARRQQIRGVVNDEEILWKRRQRWDFEIWEDEEGEEVL